MFKITNLGNDNNLNDLLISRFVLRFDFQKQRQSSYSLRFYFAPNRQILDTTCNPDVNFLHFFQHKFQFFFTRLLTFSFFNLALSSCVIFCLSRFFEIKCWSPFYFRFPSFVVRLSPSAFASLHFAASNQFGHRSWGERRNELKAEHTSCQEIKTCGYFAHRTQNSRKSPHGKNETDARIQFPSAHVQ